MDNQQSVTQPIQTPPPTTQLGQKPPKRNITAWIILFIIIGAILYTGISYLVISQFGTKKVTPTPSQQNTPSQIPTPGEKTKWQTYTNNKYKYAFNYPITWTMTKLSADQSTFELHAQDTADPAVITVKYLSENERNNIPSNYCEITDDPLRCHSYQLTKTSNALVDRLTPAEDSKVDSFISLPSNGTLRVQIIDANSDSYNTFAILVDTLKFPNEKRTYGLQICPDSWPTTQATVNYNGVSFATEDIDAAWVKENCK